MSDAPLKRGAVELRYQDLVDEKDLSDQIFEAFGPTGLGALTISGIPGFKELREGLLPLAHKLAHQPDSVKAKLEHEPSMWNAGWSHGKEKLGDKPDMAKASFYANPCMDEPDPANKVNEKYPFFYPKNIWPTEDMPELEPAFKKLGKLMYETVVLLCKAIDKLVASRVPEWKAGTLHQFISQTRKVKGRLLYYFPTEEVADDNWIGWHNDSGFLTALTSALFFDDDTGKVIPNPDENGGLYIVDRASEPVRVKIPSDHLAVQCGECLQIITGGLLLATPHSVRSSASPKGTRVGRGTFPVFIDTNWDFPLSAPEGLSRDRVFDKVMSSRVPPLQKRWTKDGTPFVDFLGDTFQQYYKWAKQLQGEAPADSN